jgi:hypothetical protein
MRTKLSWVQSNAADPLGDETGILASCYTAVRTATTCEQKLAGPLVGSHQVIIDGLARLLAQFKSDGSSGLLLSHGSAIRGVSRQRRRPRPG